MALQLSVALCCLASAAASTAAASSHHGSHLSREIELGTGAAAVRREAMIDLRHRRQHMRMEAAETSKDEDEAEETEAKCTGGPVCELTNDKAGCVGMATQGCKWDGKDEAAETKDAAGGKAKADASEAKDDAVADDAALALGVDAALALGNCTAPAGIKEEDEGLGCEEGKHIGAGQYCTPKCPPGRHAYIDIRGLTPHWECYQINQTSGSWGSTLCCTGGKLYPSAFLCINDLFDQIDKDHDGVLSSEELRAGPFNESNETNNWTLPHYDKIASIRRQKEKILNSPISGQATPPTTEQNPVVFLFVVISSVCFCLTASSLAISMFSKQHQDKSEDDVKDKTAPAQEAEPTQETADFAKTVSQQKSLK